MKPNLVDVEAVKARVRARWSLPEDVTIMVTELRRSGPGLQPVETVIAILASLRPPIKYSIPEAVADVRDAHIAALPELPDTSTAFDRHR